MSTSREFVTADVFTDQRFGGNPLAVLPAADGLSSEQMQAIANEFNLSETVFVLAPQDPVHTARFRIFTPRSEMPFAGHPTIGGAVMAARAGRIHGDQVAIEEPVGVVHVVLDRVDGEVVAGTLTAARLPVGAGRAAPTAMGAVLGVDESLVGEGAVWSCGLPFVIAEVVDLDALASVSIDPQAMAAELGHLDTADVYAVSPISDGRYRARMFAPFDGIPEDPATGSAACAFAGWWAARVEPPDGEHGVVLEQGVEMGRPSELSVGIGVQGGRVARVTVGGSVVPVQAGTITV
ncbi:MAG: PhzF family phenazine biosynthesis protein [Acidimicrobiia bacterium]|nr:PhzF family phenazine biosynthesis protein [Acidimicrobiia bacterium]